MTTTNIEQDAERWTPDFGDCEHMTVMVDWGSPGGYLLSIGRCVESVREDVEARMDIYPWGFYIDTTLCATFDIEDTKAFHVVDQGLLERYGYDEEKVRMLVDHAHASVLTTWRLVVGE